MTNKALNEITYGLYIITTKNKKEINGCVINSFMQTTSSPEQVLISINKTNHTTKLIQSTKEFNVSILNSSATFDLIKRFGFNSGKLTNKFEGFSGYNTAPNKIPYITESTNAYISAKVNQITDAGTHLIMIASVTHSEILNNLAPLTYSDYHTKIKPQPNPQKISYRCSVCGYIYEGENLPDDFICPVCKRSAEVFEKLTTTTKAITPKTSNLPDIITETSKLPSQKRNSTPPAIKEKTEVPVVKEKLEVSVAKSEKTNKKTKYICPVCGYFEESDTPVERCIICGAKMNQE